MIDAHHQAVVCPACGWKEPISLAMCPQCGRLVDGSLPAPPLAPESSRTFSLRTLMLGMTLVSVWLAVTVHWPGVGILFGVLSVPAFFRTVARKRALQLAQVEWRPIDAIGTFFLSVTLMWLFAVVGIAIFLVLVFVFVIVISVVALGSEFAILIGVAAAAILSLFLVVKVAQGTWPK